MSNDPLLTVRQLADAEGVPEWKVREWLRLRVDPLPRYRAYGILIRRSEYDAWLARRR